VAPTHRADVRRRILSRARELFRANGVRGVTMTDVARAADCSRQLVYKVFFDRRELVLAAAVDRISEIADSTATRMAVPAESFQDSFIELSVEIIETLRNDAELSALWGDGSPVTAHEALWTPELVERALRFWGPWLDAGRSQGILRDDLSNSDLADWLHTVYASIILRRNIPQEQERIMIERFVLTSLAMATITPGS
jgi:AcrR family transcriptional regulator